MEVARVLLGESLAVGVLGGTLGVASAFLGVRFVRQVLPSSLPRVGDVAVDARVLAVATAATLACTLLFSLAPLLQGRAGGLATWLRQSRGTTRQAERARVGLVVTEIALAVVLTAGAALMIRTMAALVRVDPGLRADHLLTMRLQPTGLADPEAVKSYWRTLLERVRAVPGVTAAGTILHLPTSGRSWHGDVTIAGRPTVEGASPPRTAWQAVSTGYFETAGIPLLRGRTIAESDRAGAPLVIMVNSAFAERLFPNEDPVGHQIKAGNATPGGWATIIGVVGGVRHDSLNADPAPEVYVPFEQRMVWANSLVVRTTGSPLAMAGLIRQTIWALNRDVPISEVRSMESLFSASLERPRMVLTVLGVFSALGLLLGAVGIYGVVSYSVRHRRREIGIRVALGAAPGRVVRQVVELGVRQALVGVGAGVPLALVLCRFLRGLVYGVSTTDYLSLFAVSLLLLLVGFAASVLPARRAATVDPTIALKE
jgi:predicted permease